MLHVLGLPSGKDMQRPAQFVPANSRWSAPVAVGTTMYTATSGKLRRRAERGLGDRSRQRHEAGRVVEDERRRCGRRGGVHSGRHARRRGWRRQGDRRRQGERDRRARSEDAAAEGLVHAAGCGVRHRADDPPPRRQGNRRRGDARRPRHRCSMPRRSAARITPRLSSSSKTVLGAGAHGQRRCARGVAGARAPARARRAPLPAPTQARLDPVPVTAHRAGHRQRRVSTGAVVALKLTGAGGALVARAGMGLARPLRRPPRRSSSTASCSRWPPGCPRRQPGRAGQRFCTRTTARLASGSGRAAKRWRRPPRRAVSGAGWARSTSGRATARSTRSASTTSAGRLRRRDEMTSALAEVAPVCPRRGRPHSPRGDGCQRSCCSRC